MKKLEIYIGTFGWGQTYDVPNTSYTVANLKDFFIPILAADHEEANDYMKIHFDQNYSRVIKAEPDVDYSVPNSYNISELYNHIIKTYTEKYFPRGIFLHHLRINSPVYINNKLHLVSDVIQHGTTSQVIHASYICTDIENIHQLHKTRSEVFRYLTLGSKGSAKYTDTNFNEHVLGWCDHTVFMVHNSCIKNWVYNNYKTLVNGKDVLTAVNEEIDSIHYIIKHAYHQMNSGITIETHTSKTKPLCYVDTEGNLRYLNRI